MDDRTLVEVLERLLVIHRERELTRGRSTASVSTTAYAHERNAGWRVDLIKPSQDLHVLLPQLPVHQEGPHVGVRQGEPIVQVWRGSAQQREAGEGRRRAAS